MREFFLILMMRCSWVKKRPEDGRASEEEEEDGRTSEEEEGE
jgi:hypothetical protein